MDGAELASLYAFPPNRHGYCGTRGFCATLRKFQEGKTGSHALRSELARFCPHYAYLSLIARESGLQPFDKEVVRAFWTGNSLLESVRQGALRSFIEKDLFKGKQPTRARRLCDGLPPGILPHHSFNVLYVNFVSNVVPRTVRNYDSCCVTSGKVLSISGKNAAILRRSIGYDGGFVIKEKESQVSLERGGMRFVSEVKKGDVVSVHWGMIIEKLGRKDERLLNEYTLKNMRAISDSAESKGRI
ncbi:MAG: DUF6390 family protein [Candidatus Micrarchaeota archaeon]